MNVFLREIDGKRLAVYLVVERAAAKASPMIAACVKQIEYQLFSKYFQFIKRPHEDLNNERVAIAVAQLHNKQRWIAYRAHARSIAYNFKHNPHATEWNLDTEEGVKWLLNQRIGALWPEKNEITKAAAPTLRDAENSVGQSSTFQCFKCKSRFIQHWQLQTRSADEGFTVFFQCMTCKNRWKRN